MSKKHITILLINIFISITIHAQRNYLSFDYFISQYKTSAFKEVSTELFQKLNRCESFYTGGSYHFSVDRKHSFSFGIGVSKINYQKIRQGIFPDNNQFGIATINGQVRYWSFPVSYTRICAKSTNALGYKRSRFHFGFTLTYTPAWEGKNSFTVDAAGGVDPNMFYTNYISNVQPFQHSLSFGLCNQLFLLRKWIRMDVEPYIGIGSGFFKEDGTNISNTCFGVRFRMGFNARLPTITIEKETNKISEEKKKLLEEKQKEIQKQLHKNNN